MGEDYIDKQQREIEELELVRQRLIGSAENLRHTIHKDEDKTDYTIKADRGKPRLTLVPWDIINTTAAIGEYGLTKYARNSWKTVEPARYKDAMLRHLLAYLRDPNSVDEESGLLHWMHFCWNVSVLDYFRIHGKTEADD